MADTGWKPRGFIPVVVPFRLRAITLAVASLGIGALCFTSAIKGCTSPAQPPAVTAPADPGWPPGFVELNSDGLPAAAPAPSGSASAPAPSSSAK